jgi:hypothetical protein
MRKEGLDKIQKCVIIIAEGGGKNEEKKLCIQVKSFVAVEDCKSFEQDW